MASFGCWSGAGRTREPAGARHLGGSLALLGLGETARGLPPPHGAAGGWDEWLGIVVALAAVGLFYWLGSRGGKGKR